MYTMVICKTKEANKNSKNKIKRMTFDDNDDLGGGLMRPSIDSRKLELEIIYKYLKEMLEMKGRRNYGGSYKNDYSRSSFGGGHKGAPYGNLRDLFDIPITEEVDSDPESDDGYIGYEEVNRILPVYYENGYIDKDEFQDQLLKLIKNEDDDPEQRKINDKYPISHELIEIFINKIAITKGDKTCISLGKLDESIFKVRKSEGILFAVGYADPYIFNCPPNDISIPTYSDDDEDEELKEEEQKAKYLQMIGENNPSVDMVVKKRFFMIRFPKYTHPIEKVACGINHVLVLTNRGEMYTWGRKTTTAATPRSFGQRSARGENRTETMVKELTPKEITIEENDYKQRVIEIACGYFHSMCITEHHKVFSWGRGENGRLGHGDSYPSSEPKLIEDLETEKITKISAGDKHSACINQRFELFMWGCQKNGKLGFDSNEEAKKPVKVEDLGDHEIIDVS